MAKRIRRMAHPHMKMDDRDLKKADKDLKEAKRLVEKVEKHHRAVKMRRRK